MCQCHHISVHQQLELADNRTASHILISRAKHVFQEKKGKKRQRKTKQQNNQNKLTSNVNQTLHPCTCISGTTEPMIHEEQLKAKVNVLL